MVETFECLIIIIFYDNEAGNPDYIRSVGDFKDQVDEYYDEAGEEYQYYDEDNAPDLTKPVDRIAGSFNADYSSGSVMHF
jgi:hypothetical protein